LRTAHNKYLVILLGALALSGCGSLGYRVENCLNERIEERIPDFGKVKSVLSDNDGQKAYFSIHIPSDHAKSKDSYIIFFATRITDATFEALRDDPPQSADDYGLFRDRVDRIEGQNVSLVFQHRALDFESDTIARVDDFWDGLDFFLVRKPPWLYKAVVAEGSSDNIPQEGIGRILEALDEVDADCPMPS